MNVALLAVGSRGDVQPYVALGVGLARAGHDVRLVTTDEFADLGTLHGLKVHSVPFSVQAALSERSARRAVEGGGHVASFRAFARIARTASIAYAEVARAAAQDADVLVGGLSALVMGRALEERLGIPFLPALNVPVDPTVAWPGLLVPQRPPVGHRVVNRLSHAATRAALAATLRAGADAARTEVLSLAKGPLVAGVGHYLPVDRPVLYGLSEAILPRPDDWPPGRHVVGSWFLDSADAWTPDPQLAAFLAEGEAPIYVGFGSMASDDAEAVGAAVDRAIASAGVRAIVHRGWARLLPHRSSSEIYVVESVPHAYLLPKVAAVVHHGGAGTTAAALRAGRPNVVVPFHGDQAFWARRVHDLGAGPAPLPRRRLSGDRLAAALELALHDRSVATRARELGLRIRAENGVADAVCWIEDQLTLPGVRTSATRPPT